MSSDNKIEILDVTCGLVDGGSLPFYDIDDDFSYPNIKNGLLDNISEFISRFAPFEEEMYKQDLYGKILIEQLLQSDDIGCPPTYMRVRFKYNDITLNMGISYSKHKEINFF
jgi:hypothetical protein